MTVDQAAGEVMATYAKLLPAFSTQQWGHVDIVGRGVDFGRAIRENDTKDARRCLLEVAAVALFFLTQMALSDTP